MIFINIEEIGIGMLALAVVTILPLLIIAWIVTM
jgi:hypothetical protein